MEIELILTLIASGLIVGFINTLAGGGTVISMAVFMALGVPIIEAAGTNRIAIFMQNSISTFMFRKQKMIDINRALKLSIPILLGTVIGAQFTLLVTNEIYTILFLGGLLFMAVMLIFKPSSFNKSPDGEISRITPLLWFIMFLSGLYSGSIYVGCGYIFIAIYTIGFGYDLIRANALKGFMALILAPASLILFAIHGEVNYTYGLVHGVGNIIGAYIGAKYAKKLGINFIKKILLIMIIVSIIDMVRKPFFIEYISKIWN